LKVFDVDGFDDLGPAEERFSNRKDRTKPKGIRSIRALHEPSAGADDVMRFADPGLQELYERHHLTEILWQLKSGKEATVYVAEGPAGLLAAKVYTDLRVRSFRNDRTYREGRFVADVRIQRAIDQRSTTGLSAQQALWIEEEFSQLHALYAAGLPVPQPVARAGAVVLMSFIGDEAGPAPRLADVQLSRAEAEDAFQQSALIFTRMLELGRVHGDLSTYNLLWWQERVVVIDFPQVVLIKENPHAWELLERDAVSLCSSFSRFGLKPDPVHLIRKAKARIFGEV
jgi:RIO kinase 1